MIVSVRSSVFGAWLIQGMRFQDISTYAIVNLLFCFNKLNSPNFDEVQTVMQCNMLGFNVCIVLCIFFNDLLFLKSVHVYYVSPGC